MLPFFQRNSRQSKAVTPAAAVGAAVLNTRGAAAQLGGKKRLEARDGDGGDIRLIARVVEAQTMLEMQTKSSGCKWKGNKETREGRSNGSGEESGVKKVRREAECRRGVSATNGW